MTKKLGWLKLVGRTWYVRVQVPRDVRAILGKSELWESTQTSDYKVAERIGGPIVAKFKGQIERARLERATSPEKVAQARWAMSMWVVENQTIPVKAEGPPHVEWFTQDNIALLQKAWEEPDGYQAIPGFDRYIAGLLTAYKCPTREGDPHLIAFRQEAAMTMMYMAQWYERERQSLVALRQPLEAIGKPLQPVPMLEPASIKISALYDAWKAKVKPSAKDLPGLELRKRRLIEFMGDRPINHITKAEVHDFMALVVRLPAHKRTKEQATMTIRELAAIDHPVTLTEKTVGRWYSTYRQMFGYAASKDWVSTNHAFTIEPQYVVEGRESTEKRAFTDDEIKFIFGTPLFTGSDLSDAYRSVAGDRLIEDHRYWLPILSLFTGGRIGELANIAMSEVKQAGKVHYFDLTERDVGTGEADSVKTKNSLRLIPLHPKLIELGFLDYIQGHRGGEWLFPDLDQTLVTGAEQQFGRWWAIWMTKHGMPDRDISHHSWRHTWKRFAKASPVKEEIHDIISGHKASVVSRKYGEKGLPIETLAKEMARIKFSPFPL